VLAIYSLTGRGRSSGVVVEMPVFNVFTVRDGKVARMHAYRDRSAALEAAGLAMSHGSAEVARRQFEAFGRGGLDAAAAFWHPEIDWRAVEGAPDDVGVMRGAEALRRYYAHWTEAFDELHAEVDEVIFESADRCAVVVRNSGRPRGSSALAQGRYYVVCTVREGRIVSGREYETRDEALEAVDLEQ
jgi:ketosteroid isomerase-like protein